jgi:hypothetical protein
VIANDDVSGVSLFELNAALVIVNESDFVVSFRQNSDHHLQCDSYSVADDCSDEKNCDDTYERIVRLNLVHLN